MQQHPSHHYGNPELIHSESYRALELDMLCSLTCSSMHQTRPRYIFVVGPAMGDTWWVEGLVAGELIMSSQ